ncbi:hypothetical protein GDO81_030021, partial [Engystomops pustulosus]
DTLTLDILDNCLLAMSLAYAVLLLCVMAASIRDLQGVEISVLDISLNRPLCVQFQFANTFPSQWDQNNRAWKFFFNNFEVGPSNEYEVSVQHLPRNRENSQENRLEQRFMTPGKAHYLTEKS